MRDMMCAERFGDLLNDVAEEAERETGITVMMKVHAGDGYQFIFGRDGWVQHFSHTGTWIWAGRTRWFVTNVVAKLRCGR